MNIEATIIVMVYKNLNQVINPLQNAGRSLHRGSYHRAHQREVRGAETQRKPQNFAAD